MIGYSVMQSPSESGSSQLQWLLLSPIEVRDRAFWALSREADGGISRGVVVVSTAAEEGMLGVAGRRCSRGRSDEFSARL